MKIYFKSLFILLFGILISTDLFSQYGETIRTGRPGKSIGPFSVGERVLQIQGGLEYLEDVRLASERNLTQSALILRYGISERIELSTAWAFNWETIDAPTEFVNKNGISVSQIGFRVNLSDGKKAPPMCFQYRLKFNAVSEEYKNNFMGSRALFAIAPSISKDMKLFANLGLDWNGNTASPTGIYALTYSLAIVPKLQAIIEFYGQVPIANDLFNQTWTSNIGLGIGYTVNKDLKLDLSAGGNIAEASDVVYFNIGFSWRTRFAERIDTRSIKDPNN